MKKIVQNINFDAIMMQVINKLILECKAQRV